MRGGLSGQRLRWAHRGIIISVHDKRDAAKSLPPACGHVPRQVDLCPLSPTRSGYADAGFGIDPINAAIECQIFDGQIIVDGKLYVSDTGADLFLCLNTSQPRRSFAVAGF